MSREHYVRAMALAMLPANANTLRICHEDVIRMWRDGRLSDHENSLVLEQFENTAKEIERETGEPTFVF